MADDELTDAAQAEIRKAIQIVREDRTWKLLHERLPAPKPPEADPPKDGPKDPPKDPGKPKDPPGDVPADPPPPKDPAEPPARKGLWWGDRVTDPA